MSESENGGEYLTCVCKECGNSIEFPASSARDTISCPHCGEWTELVGPEEPAEESSSINLLSLALWIALPIILLVGVVVFVHHKNSSTAENKPLPPIVKETVKPAPPVVIAPTNGTPTNDTSDVTQAPAKPRPKAFSDLKVSPVVIEKPKEGKLIYAMGTVTNDSDYQRFGVKVQLDLIGVQGGKIGTTQDYISILEPHKEWHFRALMTEPKAVAARVGTLKEEE
jgi:hypothetical protein